MGRLAPPDNIDSIRSKEIENIIHCSLQYFEYDDAIMLAEVYHETVNTSDSLYLYAYCLSRAERLEAAYNLLKLKFLSSPEIRYLFAHCCYHLEKYQEAEMALRIHDQPKLDNCFTNTSVESFAHSLLSRVFVETGRPDEAADEGKLALKQNVFSWTSLKTLCNLGVGNPENIYTSLLTCVNEARSTDKPKTSRSTSIATRNTEKLAKNAEKRTPSGSKEAEQKVIGAKRNTELSVVRRRLEEGIETRRNSRSYGISQDSENQTVVKDLRTSTRSRVAGLSGSGAPRSLQDKQLRSVNRINEMELSKTPPPISSIHKLIESNDDLPDTPPKLQDESAHQSQKSSLNRTRSGSQPCVIPLSSHDQNTVQFKQEPESLDFSVVFSRSSSSISVTSSCSPQPCRHRSREKFRLETCTRIMKRLQNFVSKPPSIQRLQYCIADWSTLFTTVIEYISWLAMLQCAVATYRSNSVIGRYNLMPEKCKKFALARELLARAYLEKLDYTKAAEILEELHREFPHRVAGMEILSTALWHAQDVRRLSVLAMQITEECRSCPEGWCVAGNCFSVQKQHDTAIECFERAVTINTRFPYAYTLLGHELRALLLCPTDYRAWFGLGLLHFKKEQVNLARVHLSRAVAINPFNSVLLCQLSVVEQALHNNDTAMELLQNALKISPDNAACRFYRARLLYEMHDYAQCLEELNDLKLIAHDEAQVFFLLGRVHKKLGGTHLALLNFSLAAEMDPRGEQSRNNFTDAPYDDEPSSPPCE
ncbi:tetratricopeptide repeat protein [Onchocerca flexuosa]|uniref:Cell division cycle protein 27 homolog n=3 Tax=Onchocerca flexuosa TaxID=387005 RepID=A0A238C642_9BILA|nr:tetratricopeptide repeat protein [Onchocerca flexuosa]